MRYERARNAALLLGVGLGGFLDGIVLHQIAHWHQMLWPTAGSTWRRGSLPSPACSSCGAPCAAPGRLPSTRTFCGYLLIGWGAFNFVEGSINHHVLQLHHVRDLPTHVPLYDWVFLIAGGIGFILAGLLCATGSEGRDPQSSAALASTGVRITNARLEAIPSRRSCP